MPRTSPSENKVSPKKLVYPLKKRILIDNVEYRKSKYSNFEKPQPVQTVPDYLADTHDKGIEWMKASKEFALELARSVTILPITCNKCSGEFYLERFLSGNRGPCVKYNNSFITPYKFIAESGCSAGPDWTSSIKYAGYDIQFLIDADILKEHDDNCDCQKCKSLPTDLEKTAVDPAFIDNLSTFNIPNLSGEDTFQYFQDTTMGEPQRNIEELYEGYRDRDNDIRNYQERNVAEERQRYDAAQDQNPFNVYYESHSASNYNPYLSPEPYDRSGQSRPSTPEAALSPMWEPDQHYQAEYDANYRSTYYNPGSYYMHELSQGIPATYDRPGPSSAPQIPAVLPSVVEKIQQYNTVHGDSNYKLYYEGSPSGNQTGINPEQYDQPGPSNASIPPIVQSQVFQRGPQPKTERPEQDVNFNDIHNESSSLNYRMDSPQTSNSPFLVPLPIVKRGRPRSVPPTNYKRPSVEPAEIQAKRRLLNTQIEQNTGTLQSPESQAGSSSSNPPNNRAQQPPNDEHTICSFCKEPFYKHSHCRNRAALRHLTTYSNTEVIERRRIRQTVNEMIFRPISRPISDARNILQLSSFQGNNLEKLPVAKIIPIITITPPFEGILALSESVEAQKSNTSNYCEKMEIDDESD